MRLTHIFLAPENNGDPRKMQRCNWYDMGEQFVVCFDFLTWFFKDTGKAALLYRVSAVRSE